MRTYKVTGTVTTLDDGSLTAILSAPADIVVVPPDPIPPDPTPPPIGGTLPRATAPLNCSGIRAIAETPTGLNPEGAPYIIPPLAIPAIGGSVMDPVFKTILNRGPAGTVPEYSQLPVWCDDRKYAVLVTPGAGYHIYSCNASGRPMAALSGSIGTGAPRWIPGTHSLLITEYGSPLPNVRMRRLDADTLTSTVAADLTAFAAADTNRMDEAMSRDGKFTGFYGKGTDGVWYICSVDLSTGQVIFKHSLAQLFAPSGASPDWINVSPLGKYVVAGWVADGAARGHGVEIFNNDATGAFVRQLYGHHNHSDQGLDPAGKECIVTTEFASIKNSNIPATVVYYHDGSAKKQLRQWAWNVSPGHYSMQGPGGIVLCSASWGSKLLSGLAPYECEIDALYFDGTIARLAHHRSKESSYWAQPHATLSRDASCVAFATDWIGTVANEAMVMTGLVL